jgi:hypothetical protein
MRAAASRVVVAAGHINTTTHHQTADGGSPRAADQFVLCADSNTVFADLRPRDSHGSRCEGPP